MKNSMKEMLFAVIVVSGAQGSSYSFAGSPDDFVGSRWGWSGNPRTRQCIGLVVKWRMTRKSKGIVSYVLPNDTEQARAR